MDGYLVSRLCIGKGSKLTFSQLIFAANRKLSAPGRGRRSSVRSDDLERGHLRVLNDRQCFVDRIFTGDLADLTKTSFCSSNHLS